MRSCAPTRHRTRQLPLEPTSPLAVRPARQPRLEPREDRVERDADRGDKEGTAVLIGSQYAALAAAPASPKITQEMDALEELKSDLSRDASVMRKRASSQRYEKQRGN